MADLNPAYPVVRGRVRLTRVWEVDLPMAMNRRIDGSDMLFFAPGISARFACWTNADAMSREERLRGLRGSLSSNITDLEVVETDKYDGFRCRSIQQGDTGTVYCRNAAFAADQGHMIVGVTYETSEFDDLAAAIIDGVGVAA